MRVRPRGVAVHSAISSLLACACSQAPDELVYCEASAALNGGGSNTSYLAFDAVQASAIGVIESPLVDGFCVGTRVARRWVLSAAHCAALPQPSFVTAQGQAIPITRVVAHASRDVALFQIEPDDCTSISSLPLARISESQLPRLSRGTVAGLLERVDSPAKVGFLIEPVSEVNDEYVAVDGRGKTGACAGDSGGPLLVRDDAGLVAILGVLSKGEASCRGIDYYARVDGLTRWVMELSGELEPPRQGCGDLDGSGRCFDGRAVWCESERPTVQSCTDEICGWSPEQGGFRCGARPVCEGDATGRCEGDTVIECTEGERAERSCPGGCGFDPHSGVARCE